MQKKVFAKHTRKGYPLRVSQPHREMKYTVKKSTIREQAPGYSGGTNNCRFSGKSTLWVVEDESGIAAHEGKTKKLAERLCEFANRIGYDGRGDLEMMLWDEDRKKLIASRK